MAERPLPQERDEAVDRIRRELRILVRNSDLTQRRLEEKNQFAQGYLSQVLQGNITLTMRHVIGILSALGIEPAGFFAHMFADAPATDPMTPYATEARLAEIRERLERYDRALEELERRGLVSPADEED